MHFALSDNIHSRFQKIRQLDNLFQKNSLYIILVLPNLMYLTANLLQYFHKQELTTHYLLYKKQSA